MLFNSVYIHTPGDGLVYKEDLSRSDAVRAHVYAVYITANHVEG